MTLLALTWACAAAAEDVAISVGESDGQFEVRGEFLTTARPEVVWAVLTDYDHISTFVRSMRSSHAERSVGGAVTVHQEAVAGVFPFRKTVRLTLEIQRTHGRLSFRDVLGRDFRHYQGAWEVYPDSGLTAVHYEVDARPRAAVPHLISRGLMRGSAHDLLLEVQAEIARRAAAGPATGVGANVRNHASVLP